VVADDDVAPGAAEDGVRAGGEQVARRRHLGACRSIDDADDLRREVEAVRQIEVDAVVAVDVIVAGAGVDGVVARAAEELIAAAAAVDRVGAVAAVDRDRIRIGVDVDRVVTRVEELTRSTGEVGGGRVVEAAVLAGVAEEDQR